MGASGRSFASAPTKDDDLKNEISELKRELRVLQNDNELETMTLVQLRELMKKIAKSSRGTKQELLSRITEFLESESPHSDVVVAEARRATKRVRVESKTEQVSGKVSRRKTTTRTTTQLTTSVVGPWTMLRHKKLKPDWIVYNPCTMRPANLSSRVDTLKVLSWNINGLRACLKQEKRDPLAFLAETEDFDIICLQETKLQEEDVDPIRETILSGYNSSFWTCSTTKLGYSGSALISRVKPISVTYGLGCPAHDEEGRVITAEFESFILVCVYVPNSGRELERLTYRTTEWDPAFSAYLLELEKRKPVVVTGDLNCAHEEIDIYDPDGNKRNAGFTEEERSSFKTNLLNKGFVDTFRRQHPCAVGFTYWTYRRGCRNQNKGWRLDYFLVSQCLADSVVDSYVLPHVYGSDHCPIGLILKKLP